MEIIAQKTNQRMKIQITKLSRCFIFRKSDKEGLILIWKTIQAVKKLMKLLNFYSRTTRLFKLVCYAPVEWWISWSAEEHNDEICQIISSSSHHLVCYNLWKQNKTGIGEPKTGQLTISWRIINPARCPIIQIIKSDNKTKFLKRWEGQRRDIMC